MKRLNKFMALFVFILIFLIVFCACDASKDTGDTRVTDTTVDITTEEQADSTDVESINNTESDTETQTGSESAAESANETESETDTQTETESEEETQNPALELVDFIVSVPADREAVILQLTDTQIIDASQARTEDRFGAAAEEYWGADKTDERCYDYIREVVQAISPDLILLTGDLVYGKFDDNGSRFLELIEVMESFGVPWAPVFGNHENESKMGVDWQSEQLEAAENCLFLQRTLTGNGNYTVGIEQGGKLVRVFFMLDSNGCGAASAETKANGHTKTSPGFGHNQINWFTRLANNIQKQSPNTKISLTFHIQLSMFGEAFTKYGTDGTNRMYIDYDPNREDGDFGFIGAKLKSAWDTDKTLWNKIKRLKIDSILVGHVHENSSSIIYDGVRLQYGQKSSTYDRANYIDAYGNILTSTNNVGTPLVGGTVFNLSREDGTIVDARIYYCESAGGNVDWSKVDTDKGVDVTGLQSGSDLTLQSGISMKGIQFDTETSAYRVRANNQGKVYVNTELLKNKSTFTFSVYIPATSTAKIGGYGEFAIRTKPNQIEPDGDGTVSGYINYNSSSKLEEYKIVFDTWQTFTVDISAFGENCTEFAFVIAQGNTIYLRDMVIK